MWLRRLGTPRGPPPRVSGVSTREAAFPSANSRHTHDRSAVTFRATRVSLCLSLVSTLPAYIRWPLSRSDSMSSGVWPGSDASRSANLKRLPTPASDVSLGKSTASSTADDPEIRRRGGTPDVDGARPMLESHGNPMEELLKAPITVKVRPGRRRPEKKTTLSLTLCSATHPTC